METRAAGEDRNGDFALDHAPTRSADCRRLAGDTRRHQWTEFYHAHTAQTCQHPLVLQGFQDMPMAQQVALPQQPYNFLKKAISALLAVWTLSIWRCNP